MSRGFEGIDTWVFDLDNTLYPASCRLFDQMDVRMGEFVSRLLGIPHAEAKIEQKRMFHHYGTTLRGLMTEHGVEPKGFLDHAHDIDYTPVPESPDLDRALEALPGRKLIFTNGTAAHAEKVVGRLGVGRHFAEIFDIVHSDYEPKPAEAPYRKFAERTGIDPARAAFFEDIARNLEPAHAMGMTTVLVTSPDNREAHKINGHGLPHYVHHVTGDLAGFLARLPGRIALD